MFTYNERDLHRMPTPSRTHLPIKTFIAESQILDEESARDNEADIALLRLPAPSLRGTFAKAYTLLTKLVMLVGWDELLKARSSVFVMEEEYRQQKQADDGGVPLVPADDPKGKARDDGGGDSDDGYTEADDSRVTADDDASIKGVSSRTHSQRERQATMEAPSSPIPTIKVSTESDGARERQLVRERLEEEGLEEDRPDEEKSPALNGTTEGEVGVGPKSAMAGSAPGLDKPMAMHVAAPTEPAKDGLGLGDVEAGRLEIDKEQTGKPAKPTGTPGFSNKRLCERWLDNLFMVLYEVRRRPHSRS